MSKLLIVDDETNVCEFAQSFFRKRGVETFIALSGEEALAVIAKERPDLVLLDIRMAGMSGIEALRELRQRDDSTRVMMVSGLEDDKAVEEAKSLGALDFVRKPLVLEDLERVVLSELKQT